MNALDIHSLLSALLFMWVGGAFVMFLFAESAGRNAANKSLFMLVALFLSMTWPISVWFLTEAKADAKKGPWNP